MVKWIGREASLQELAYAAGALDGEGCIHIGHRTSRNTKYGVKPVYLSVSLANTDPRMPIFMRDIFGGNLSQTKEKRSNRKPCLNWLISGRPAGVALKGMMPFLIVKKEQALVALSFVETIIHNGPISEEILLKRHDLKNNLHELKSWRPELKING